MCGDSCTVFINSETIAAIAKTLLVLPTHSQTLILDILFKLLRSIVWWKFRMFVRPFLIPLTQLNLFNIKTSMNISGFINCLFDNTSTWVVILLLSPPPVLPFSIPMKEKVYVSRFKTETCVFYPDIICSSCVNLRISDLYKICIPSL